MRYLPLGDGVLVEMDSLVEFGGGLITPDTCLGMPHVGTVRAVGPGGWTRKGARRLMPFERGQRVLIPHGVGVEIIVGGKLHRQVPAAEVMGYAE